MSTARLWLDALTRAGKIERRPDGKVEVPAPPKPAWSNRSFLSDEAAEWHSCPCGTGPEKCPGPDGKPLCAD